MDLRIGNHGNHDNLLNNTVLVLLRFHYLSFLICDTDLKQTNFLYFLLYFIILIYQIFTAVGVYSHKINHRL